VFEVRLPTALTTKVVVGRLPLKICNFLSDFWNPTAALDKSIRLRLGLRKQLFVADENVTFGCVFAMTYGSRNRGG
jgi:hypothetical protein